MDESVLYTSIYKYMEIQLQLTIKSAHKIIRTAKPNDMDKKYLHFEETDPVLEVDQIAFLDNGTIFEYSFSRHPFY
ncbi:UTRA domain-containing protein [Shimazuella alba]|uniref:UTRA domain-containing protein n=1 Tax=Shimazuella alba TaxID=2690964 RepID=A0A6I4VY27_9BACL|nr:UTRA domain-containing protein [Shimazuella alba]